METGRELIYADGLRWPDCTLFLGGQAAGELSFLNMCESWIGANHGRRNAMFADKMLSEPVGETLAGVVGRAWQ